MDSLENSSRQYVFLFPLFSLSTHDLLFRSHFRWIGIIFNKDLGSMIFLLVCVKAMLMSEYPHTCFLQSNLKSGDRLWVSFSFFSSLQCLCQNSIIISSLKCPLADGKRLLEMTSSILITVFHFGRSSQGIKLPSRHNFFRGKWVRIRLLFQQNLIGKISQVHL